MARTFWFKPAKRDQATDVSATPNARPIAFQQVVPELFRSFIKFLRVTFLLALCWHFGSVKFATPCPNDVWNWRRGSESNRRMELLQSSALPLGYPAVSGMRDLRSAGTHNPGFQSGRQACPPECRLSASPTSPEERAVLPPVQSADGSILPVRSVVCPHRGSARLAGAAEPAFPARSSGRSGRRAR